MDGVMVIIIIYCSKVTCPERPDVQCQYYKLIISHWLNFLCSFSNHKICEIHVSTTFKTVFNFTKLVYAIVWLAVAFGINSASNAGSKAVIAWGEAKQYYIFQAALWELLIPGTTVNHTSTN